MAATALHEQGIALARATGADLSECQHLQGLVDALAMVENRADPPRVGGPAGADLVDACTRAVRRLHELRYWLYLWRVADTAAWVLARAGNRPDAATLLGHLEAHAPAWRSQPRGATKDLLAAIAPGDEPASETWAETGAALDRDAVVDRTLTALESLPPPVEPAGWPTRSPAT